MQCEAVGEGDEGDEGEGVEVKLVTLKQLLHQPSGTIFREFEPCVFHGEWMRLHGPCGDRDFYYSDIGPTTANARDSFLSFDDAISRDGLFEDDRMFVVLDSDDIEVFCKQLRGECLTQDDTRKFYYGEQP